MTIFSRDSRQSKRNKFNGHGNGQEDDLILADLRASTDDNGLQIAPLRHWQDPEDTTDHLLVNSDFDGFEENNFEDYWHEPPATEKPAGAEESAMPNEAGLLVSPLAFSTPDSYVKPREGIKQPAGAGHCARLTPLLDELDLTMPADAPEVVAMPTDTAFKAALASQEAMVLPIETQPPFLLSPFVSSHQSRHADFNAGQSIGCVSDAEEQKSEQSQEEAVNIRAKTSESARLAFVGASEATALPGLSGDQRESGAIDKITKRSGKPRKEPLTSTKQLPIWASFLTIAVLMLLIATTANLFFTVSALKTEVVRLSALLTIVKDDVEVLGQK